MRSQFLAFYCHFSLVRIFTLGDHYHDHIKNRGEETGGLHSTSYADWEKMASDSIEKIINDYKENVGRAKNVIFFLGDGMGISTETIARIHQAQEKGITLDKSRLAWDTWMDKALIRTYNTNASPPDSAGTATAFLCGRKTKIGTIGVDENVEFNKCETISDENKLQSTLHRAIEQDKWTGIITTTRITHATVAAAYSHAPSRDWETYVQVPDEDHSNCPDIAKQLVHKSINKHIKVIMGGGRAFFMSKNDTDPEYNTTRGYRPDTNLIQDWLRIKKQMGLHDPQYTYVYNVTQFDDIDPDKTDYILGLFEPSHMQYELDRHDHDGQGEPHIADMTEKAIKLLSRGPEGYFLFVEGGRIDHGHHQTKAKKAFAETMALSEAVERAVSLTDQKDTLIVVTADHSHTITMGGYSHIDTPLYGPATNFTKELYMGLDGLGFLKLAYANGPGQSQHRTENNTRKDVSSKEAIGDFNDRDFVQDTIAPLVYETHAADDVAAHATGPWAHLFKGIQEQHYVAHAIMFSACLSPYDKKEHCLGKPKADPKPRPEDEEKCPSSSGLTSFALTHFWITSCFLVIFKAILVL